jgi:hypothetical protein
MRLATRKIVPTLRLLAVLLASAGVLPACGGSSGSSSSVTTATAGPTTSAAAATTTAAPAGQAFTSKLYHYALNSPDWIGTSAQTAWDGTGAPGDGDVTVDSLVGPDSQRAFAFGEPTRATLKKFVAQARTTNHNVRPACPAKPEKTGRTTIDAEPAIVDELHCGVFALSAYVIHAGRVYAFFTYDQPGNEAAMRAWFSSLLKTVSLGV